MLPPLSPPTLSYCDSNGMESLTKCKLGDVLGVEAMSLYNHVANKDDLLNGMIELPAAGNWKQAMRRRAISARDVLAIDSYIYGFALQERGLPFDAAELAPVMLAQFPAKEFPNLAEFTFEHVMKPGYDFAKESEYGLDLILDGLEKARRAKT